MSSQRSERAVEGLRPPKSTSTVSSPTALETSRRLRAAAGSNGADAMSLHVTRLRGISLDVRMKLKRQGVSYTSIAARGRERRALPSAGCPQWDRRGDPDAAGAARRPGAGQGHRRDFADMLEMIGVDQVAVLAGRDSATCMPVSMRSTRRNAAAFSDAGRGAAMDRAGACYLDSPARGRRPKARATKSRRS